MTASAIKTTLLKNLNRVVSAMELTALIMFALSTLGMVAYLFGWERETSGDVMHSALIAFMAFALPSIVRRQWRAARSRTT